MLNMAKYKFIHYALQSPQIYCHEIAFFFNETRTDNGQSFQEHDFFKKKERKKISPCKEDLTIKPSYLMAGKGCGDTDVRI